MRGGRRVLGILFSYAGGCLTPSLFLCAGAFADTLTLKNGKELKGLVVEQHADRVIVSTAGGEIPILKTGIKDIVFDDPAQNFFKAGKSYEAENKLGEALAYYEKATELNPQFEEAKKAAMGVRNRFWAKAAEGPRSEMEKQQALYDSWGQQKSPEDLVKNISAEEAKSLAANLGLVLAKRGDWVYASRVDPKKDAAVAGMKKDDRFVAVDDESLRYLGAEVVTKKLLEPRYSSFTLEFERDCFLHKSVRAQDLKSLGLKLRLEYQGVLIDAVEPQGPAALAGLKEGDLLSGVNGAPTRYLPLRKISEIVQKTGEGPVVFTVHRQALLTRK